MFLRNFIYFIIIIGQKGSSIKKFDFNFTYFRIKLQKIKIISAINKSLIKKKPTFKYFLKIYI